MNNDRPEKVKDKINIIARKKQIIINKMIYHIFKQERKPNNAKQN